MFFLKKNVNGSFLVKEGQILNESYIEIEGCARKIYLVDGDEKASYFYTQESSVVSLHNYIKQTPVNHF